MGNEPSQLKTTDTLNDAASRTDEVESNLNDSWFHRDVVFDVQTRGVVAEEEHQLLNKPNPVSKPENAGISVGKLGYWQRDSPWSIATPNQVNLWLVLRTCCFCCEVCKQGMHVVEISTMIFAENLVRTLSGRHHVRQISFSSLISGTIKQLNEPTDVKIIECNISGFHIRLEVDFTCLLRVHAILVD
ncbi:hypothetical protein Bca101_058035 [Brassica carinata]